MPDAILLLKSGAPSSHHGAPRSPSAFLAASILARAASRNRMSPVRMATPFPSATIWMRQYENGTQVRVTSSSRSVSLGKALLADTGMNWNGRLVLDDEEAVLKFK